MRYVTDRFENALAGSLRATLDERLEEKYTVKGSVTKRAIEVAPGLMNFELRDEGDRAVIEFNFHVSSLDGLALRDWLGRADEFCSTAEDMLAFLNISTEKDNVKN